MSVVPAFCLSIRSNRHGVCRSYMCASNSGAGPDEKKTSIEVNKQATVYRTELNGERDVIDAIYSE